MPAQQQALSLPAIMTTDRKLKIIFGVLSVGLLTTLFIKLKDVPGGMILSGLFLGGMIIVGIIIGCLIFSGILRLIFKRFSFLTLLFITTTISFLAFHYQLYSPTLTIIVPDGYRGEINLVLSNVDDNILITFLKSEIACSYMSSNAPTAPCLYISVFVFIWKTVCQNYPLQIYSVNIKKCI